MGGDGGLGLGVRVRMRGVVTGGDGGLVLGVRVRMRADFTTKAPLFHSKIAWLGVAPNFPVFFLRVSARRLFGADASNSLRTEPRKKTLID